MTAPRLTEVQQAELAAYLREAVTNITEAAWNAAHEGLTLEATLVGLVPGSEDLVQAIVRAVSR